MLFWQRSNRFPLPILLADLSFDAGGDHEADKAPAEDVAADGGI